MPRVNLENIKPGDVLLYKGTGLVSSIIRTKTWSDWSHCEIYEGHGCSLAARDGLRCDRWDVRTNDLDKVLRLTPYLPGTKIPMPFDMATAVEWFESTAKGQPYDFLGLMSFMTARWQGRENGKLFCSEFAARWFRYGIAGALGLVDDGHLRLQLRTLGLDPWRGKNADAIPPQGFDDSPFFIDPE